MHGTLKPKLVVKVAGTIWFVSKCLCIPLPQPRVAESVCYKRSKIESARSRGECLTPRRRVAQQAGCSYTQAPKVDEQPDPSGPQADACTTPSALPLQYYTNMDMDLAKYLHPGGLFEYLKLHYPDIVSIMFCCCRRHCFCMRNVTLDWLTGWKWSGRLA